MTASHKEGRSRPKVDLLVKLKAAVYGNEFEFAVCESAKDGDVKHFFEDRLKVAKTLKNFYDQISQFMDPSGVRFIGIHSMGIYQHVLMPSGPTVDIYELDRRFEEFFCFHQLASFSLARDLTPRTYKPILSACDAMITLRVLIILLVNRVREFFSRIMTI